MSTVKKVARNTTYLAIADVFSKGLQFLIMLAAARVLTVEHFGLFNFALSFSFIAIILADFGVNRLLIREVARKKKQAGKYLSNALVLKTLLSAATLLIIGAAMELFQFSESVKQVTYIMLFFSVLLTYTELWYATFRAFERMQFDAGLKIVRMVLLFSLSITLLLKGYGVEALSWSFVAIEAIIAVFGFVLLMNNFPVRLQKPQIKELKPLFVASYPFGLSIVFSSIYFYIASLILGKIEGEVAVGIFSAAFNLALALLFIPTVFTNALYPLLSRLYVSSKRNLARVYEKSWKVLYIVGLPLSVGGYLLAEPIILLVYGQKYAESILVLQIISAYFVLKFVIFLLGIMLSSMNRQKTRMTIQGITSLFNVLINLALIPLWGIVGAAWSTLITEILLFILYSASVSRVVSLPNIFSLLIKPLIAVGVMAAVLMNVSLHVILLIPLGATIYGIVLLMLRTVTKEEYALIRGILTK